VVDSGAPEQGAPLVLGGPAVVAALYVQRDGVYANLPGVEIWDESRDARRYAGPWPVVAHPPCTRWSLMGLCRGYYDGDDDGCFEQALAAVRRFGGVLEHPAHTLAWKAFQLPRPAAAGWAGSLFDDGCACEVDQRHYGHEARKPTWLYCYGTATPALRWGRAAPGAKTVGRSWGQHRSDRGRSRTPPPFRDVLLGMARSAYVRHA
jgi:hypothetical protein